MSNSTTSSLKTMTDMYLTKILLGEGSDSLSNSSTISGIAKQLITATVMSSIDEIKQCVGSFLSYVRTYISNNYQSWGKVLYNAIKVILYGLKLLTGKWIITGIYNLLKLTIKKIKKSFVNNDKKSTTIIPLNIDKNEAGVSDHVVKLALDNDNMLLVKIIEYISRNGFYKLSEKSNWGINGSYIIEKWTDISFPIPIPYSDLNMNVIDSDINVTLSKIENDHLTVCLDDMSIKFAYKDQRKCLISIITDKTTDTINLYKINNLTNVSVANDIDDLTSTLAWDSDVVAKLKLINSLELIDGLESMSEDTELDDFKEFTSSFTSKKAKNNRVFAFLSYINNILISSMELDTNLTPDTFKQATNWYALFGITAPSMASTTKQPLCCKLGAQLSVFNGYLKLIDKKTMNKLIHRIYWSRNHETVCFNKPEGRDENVKGDVTIKEVTIALKKLTHVKLSVNSSVPSHDSKIIQSQFEDFVFLKILGQSESYMELHPQEVYHIECCRLEHIETIPNPVFVEWEQNIQYITNMSKKLSNDIGEINGIPMVGVSTNPFYSSLSKPASTNTIMDRLAETITDVPPRTITKTTVSRTIKSNLINNRVYKPFSSLFLHPQDHSKITNALKLFRDKKEVLHDLGLPNKFSLLMTGPPGTGKTSTMYAIATNLNMPIYYIHMYDNMTCGELRDMFYHIYQVKGGGIVIFEDIDLMTNITSDIYNSDDMSISELQSSDDCVLTPSYFLQFLDGVLSQDKSVIVMTTNHPEKLSPAFKRAGRFDLIIELGNCDHTLINTICQRVLNRTIEQSLLCKLPLNLSPATIIYHLKNYILNPEESMESILLPLIEFNENQLYRTIDKITTKKRNVIVSEIINENESKNEIEIKNESDIKIKSEIEIKNESNIKNEDEDLKPITDQPDNENENENEGEGEGEIELELTDEDEIEDEESTTITSVEIKEENDSNKLQFTISSDDILTEYDLQCLNSLYKNKTRFNEVVNKYPLIGHFYSKISSYNYISDKDFTFNLMPVIDKKYDKKTIVTIMKNLLDECECMRGKVLKVLISLTIAQTMCDNYQFTLDHEKLRKAVIDKFCDDYTREKDILSKVLNILGYDYVMWTEFCKIISGI